MTRQNETQEPVGKQILFTDGEGHSLESLVKPPEDAALVMQGEILKTEKGQNGRTYYEIFELEHGEDTVVARCRPITPRYLNAIILPAVLIGTWFLISYLAALIGLK